MKKVLIMTMVSLLLMISLLYACGNIKQKSAEEADTSQTAMHSEILDGYSSSKQHWQKNGFQDYTDYCEYIYTINEDSKFAESQIYSEVTESDLTILMKFFDDFERWIAFREKNEEWYSFMPKLQVQVGDYFIIETRYLDSYYKMDKEQQAYFKFSSYDIYYYDVNQHILYFFHNNT